MNKAFVREPDDAMDRCPRCGSPGRLVPEETLAVQLAGPLRRLVAASASFCPHPRCEVVYFDSLERFVPADLLAAPVWPKDPRAPLCPCFGLTADDVEADVAENGVARVRAAIEKARSSEARCRETSPTGRSCVADIQAYYMKRRRASQKD
jgi:hypothetical protein